MTVDELIQQLAKCDPKARVLIWTSGSHKLIGGDDVTYLHEKAEVIRTADGTELQRGTTVVLK